MEIKELKEQLDIYQVAERLGIKINKYHKAHCPFHDDKRPSFQFSKEKQIVTCFSSNCDAGTMDAIGLVEKKLKLTTHEALEWLKKEFNLITHSSNPIPQTPQINYPKLFRTFEGNLKKSQKAKDYLKERGLAENSEIGYNSQSWEKMKSCIIFPLKNKKGEIVSFYGRSILKNIKSNGHFYNTNRKGLYPNHPNEKTEILILTESVIDAATLKIHTDYEVLALYGTNGFTSEHSQALSQLKELKEIIFFLDGDAAGKAAVKKTSSIIKEMGIQLEISFVETPEGEDINSLVQSHEPEILNHLIKNRISQTVTTESQNKMPAVSRRLNTENAELLLFTRDKIQITVLGGIKITGLDRLRVTLKIEHQEHLHFLPIRHNLDLYHSTQVKQLTTKINEQLAITSKESVELINELTNQLEKYRTERQEELKPKQSKKKELTPSERAAALASLQSPNLIQETVEKIKESGIIGEEKNALIAYLVYTSRKRSNPLHLMCLGASGTGKTHLQEKLGELIPEEDKLEITTLSENAFYYFGKEELKNKLILIEDLDGAEAVLYPLRELQSKKRISKTVTLKDSKGNLKTQTLKVEGPVCVSGCTTREKIYEDNANRCLLLYIDGSKEQDQKIMLYQQLASSGQLDKTKELAAKESIQNMQRLLRKVEVRNPYAHLIQLPESVFKPRRTMVLLLSFIETITFYHQWQRHKQLNPETKEEYIESTYEDVELAFTLLKEILFTKSDELSGACRRFFEKLKGLKGEEIFRGNEVRQELRIAPSTLKRYLFELTRYGYFKIAGGSKYKGYEYQLTNMKEYEKLKNSIDSQLNEILKKIGSLSQ